MESSRRDFGLFDLTWVHLERQITEDHHFIFISKKGKNSLQQVMRVALLS